MNVASYNAASYTTRQAAVNKMLEIEVLQQELFNYNKEQLGTFYSFTFILSYLIDLILTHNTTRINELRDLFNQENNHLIIYNEITDPDSEPRNTIETAVKLCKLNLLEYLENKQIQFFQNANGLFIIRSSRIAARRTRQTSSD